MADWTPVGTAKDLQDEPATIDVVAMQLVAEVEWEWQPNIEVLDQMPAEEIWVGAAADAFVQARTEVAGAADNMAKMVVGIAAALKGWADTVERHIEDAVDARDAARDADEDIRAAGGGVDEMREFATRAEVTAMKTGDPVAAWTGPDWFGLLEDARERRRQAQADFDAVVVRHAEDAQLVAGRIEDFLEALPAAPDLGSWAGALPRAQVGKPDFGTIEFVVTDDGLVMNTPESWRQEVYRMIGVDQDHDPADGMDGLGDIPADMWDFYGELFEMNPDEFQWAGLANLAGTQVWAGMKDLRTVREAVRQGTMTPQEAFDALMGDGIPDWMVALSEFGSPGYPGMQAMVDMTGDEFVDSAEWLEVMLLRMQRDIFDDLAWQHLAYMAGGMEAIEAIRQDDPDVVTSKHVEAWQAVADGRTDDALEKFADHEQNDILQESYDQILDRPDGWVWTWVITASTRAPTPDRTWFWGDMWQRATVDVPDWIPGVGDEVGLTGLPGELPPNVANETDRWDWVILHLAGQFKDGLESGEAQELIAIPVDDLSDEWKVLPG